jgi:hypothetical protein
MNKTVAEMKEKVANLRYRSSTIIIIAVIIVFLLGAFTFVPKIQQNIRASQLSTLVYQQVDSKKVKFLDYKTADTTISEQSAISVMFAHPSGKTYNKLVKMFNSKKMDEFNRILYLYPVVYNQEKTQKDYKIKADKVTLVFYENGQEKKRYVVDESTDLDTMFIPELNRLPMGNGIETTNNATSTETSQRSVVTEE